MFSLNVDPTTTTAGFSNAFAICCPTESHPKNRSAALTIGINGLKNGGNFDVFTSNFYVFAKGTVDVGSGLGGVAGDLNLSTLGKLQTSSTLETKIESTTKVDVKAKTGIDIETTTGNITAKAPAGNFDVDALKIYLN